MANVDSTRRNSTTSMPAVSAPAPQPKAKAQPTGFSNQSSFQTNAYVPAGDGSGAQTPTTKQPLNQGSMRAADSDYDKYKNMGAPTTRAMLNLLDQHKNDPDYVSELVSRMKDGNEGVLDYVVTNMFAKSGSNEYPYGFSDGDRQLLIDSLNTAKGKGYFLDSDVRDHAANGNAPWTDVANRMGVGDLNSTPADDSAMKQLDGAKKAVDGAQKKCDDLDEKLSKELADFGPALTPDQRQKYISAYRADHAEEYKALDDARANLGQVLDQNRTQLEDAAVHDPQAQQKLYDALKSAAQSPGSAVAALTIARDIEANPSSELGQAFAKFGSFDDEVLSPAVSSAAGELLAKDGDPATAFEELKELIEPIKAAKELAGGPSEIGEAYEALEKAGHGDPSAVEKLAEDWTSKNPLAKAFAAAGLVFGAKAGVDAAQKGDYLDAVNKLAQTGKDGAEILAGATKALADAHEYAAWAGDAAKVSDLAADFIPGLGLLANATALAGDVMKAKDEPIGGIISVLGDTIAVTGGIVNLCGPEALPVGELFEAVGGMVSAAGELVSSLVERHEFTEDQKKYLTAAGVTGDLQETLLDAKGGRVRELTEELGLGGYDVEQLAQKYPALLTQDSGNGYDIGALKQIVKAYGLSPEETFAFLNRIGEGSDDPNYTLSVVANNLMRDTGGVAQSQGRFEDLLRARANDSSAPADYRSGFANALDFLTHLNDIRNTAANP